MRMILLISQLLSYSNNIDALHTFMKMIQIRFIIIIIFFFTKLQEMVSEVLREEVVKIFTTAEICVEENRTTGQ